MWAETEMNNPKDVPQGNKARYLTNAGLASGGAPRSSAWYGAQGQGVLHVVFIGATINI